MSSQPLSTIVDPQSGQGVVPQQTSSASADLPDVVSGANPLVAAANPVLNLIPQLRALLQLDDPGKLREFLIEKLRTFERTARERGVTPETSIGARYRLCTLLDETATQTPWGGSGAWSRHSLLVTFHNETWGGEKFFQLLSKLAQNPQQHRDLLELMYYCICLGFEGRFRILDNGRAQLETLRQRLWQILRDSRGNHDEQLAPHWRGETGAMRAGWRVLPAWVVACAALLLGLGVYLWFTFSLANKSDKAFAQISGLRVSKPAVVVAKPGPVRFAKFLEPEVKEGLVTVRDESDRSVVVLRGDGLFSSGSAVVRERYGPVLQRVADALRTVRGDVVVSGYTDNVPIRTARYPSNFQLSQDRADQVMAILRRTVVDGARIKAQGLGAAEPIAPNETPDGRSRNRRVEIVLFAAPKQETGK